METNLWLGGHNTVRLRLRRGLFRLGLFKLGLLRLGLPGRGLVRCGLITLRLGLTSVTNITRPPVLCKVTGGFVCATFQAAS